ncbi:flagellar motor switch protein FliN [Shinella yambaruensis]|uniref:Flagellar motor switch protein FliN n=1 Tax=Shinella yambaruensis TaxID=415996 RepID=A0ABQ5ZF89_9HYPH|nr:MULTISPECIES: flagellar motor switch protein FliN [Shinella]CAI0340910.1 Flagellar motor switch protein FliN [Rhizobiaceae bacterium]CAK7259256.1 Flagellar motor switch protein FliN [Shinella sp. WSC3-e]MCJ8026112.1 flagellar motor switch protein FliN [Shinella yambaruensis]MCO5136901.1 flagellar motor switch protein FliN [Shinella sp.]MCU7978166.1 flagellar motor switch protein FliN [Shinella yambaruensis]
MAPKKTPIADDMTSSLNAGDQELEQAIDDLRGVLQKDSSGSFGADLPATVDNDPLAAFGGSDFGGGAATTDFGAGAGFGGSDFGGGDFSGGSDFSAELGEAPRPGSALQSNLDLIMDIPIDLQIVLGSSQMQVSSLMNLSEGATIALDRRIGEPVEVMVNGRVIGRGEITVLENDDTRFGVKLIEVKSTRKV